MTFPENLTYETQDGLLAELQREIVESFTGQNISYRSMDDIKHIIRYFFEYAEKMPRLHERLLCSGSYEHVGDRINEQIMAYRAERYRGAFSVVALSDVLLPLPLMLSPRVSMLIKPLYSRRHYYTIMEPLMPA